MAWVAGWVEPVDLVVEVRLQPPEHGVALAGDSPGRGGRELLQVRRRVVQCLLPPSPVTLFFAKCLLSWSPSSEIRTAHAKFTDFHISENLFH